MIYTIWTHAFHLPGATTDQYSCEMLKSKTQLIGAIMDLLEECRETLINLDDAETELDELLEDLESDYNDPDIEEQDLTNRTWEVGSLEITIHMAEPFPDVLKVFKGVIEDVTGEDPDSYADLEEEYDDEDDEEDEDEEFFDERELLLCKISRIDEDMTEAEFRDIFSECEEYFGEWATF